MYYFKKTILNRLYSIIKITNCRFERVFKRVEAEVVKNLDKKRRTQVINYFISVAFDSFHIGNYN